MICNSLTLAQNNVLHVNSDWKQWLGKIFIQSSANLRHKMPSSLPALVSQSHKKMKESIKSEELSLPLLIERDSKLNSSNTCSTLNQIGHQKVLPDIRPPQSKQSLKSDDSSTNLACPDTNELPSIARDARPNAKVGLTETYSDVNCRACNGSPYRGFDTPLFEIMYNCLCSHPYWHLNCTE